MKLLFVLPLAAQTPVVLPTGNCTIEGNVTNDLNGTPVPGAEIYISPKSAKALPIMVTTDPSGHFGVDLQPGHYSLRAERTGYVAQTYGRRRSGSDGVTLILAAGQKLHGIDFRLVATGVIVGRVSGEDNEPRVGAFVQAFLLGYIQGERRLIEAGHATTDDLGAYRVYGLQPDHYYIGASDSWWAFGTATTGRPRGDSQKQRYVPTLYPNASDYERATVVDLQPGAEVRGVDIVTLRSHTHHVRGKILGAQLARALRVQLHPVDILGLGGGDIAPDAQGNFDFGDLFPGSYVLSAEFGRDAKFYSAWRRIQVGDEDVDGVSLTPSAWMELPGRIRLEGEKRIDLGTLTVNLRSSAISPFTIAQPSVKVSSDGSFIISSGHETYQVAISGLPEDFYVKSVRLGDEKSSSRSIDLSGAEAPPSSLTIVVSASGARIDGIVKGEKDRPVNGALVALVPDSKHRSERYLFKEKTTDPDGSFTIRGVQPGKYKLFAWYDVELGACQNPEFLMPYEEQGEEVEVEANGRETRVLRLIAAQAPP